jgi:hypothetical protein
MFLKKGLIFFSLVLLFSTLVSAATLTIEKPYHTQSFWTGDIIDIKITTDYDMSEISMKYTKSSTGSQFPILKEEFISDGIQVYETTLDTVGMNSGFYYLTVYGSTFPDEDGKYKKYFKQQYFYIIGNADSEGNITVMRTGGDIAYPGGEYQLTLKVLPQKDITGIVLTENLPEGFEWNPGPLPFGVEPKYEGDVLKHVMMSSETIENSWIIYYQDVPMDAVAGSKHFFDGNWEIIGETGDIIGKEYVQIAGYEIPQCPMTDSQLLQYIDQWSKTELSNDENENDLIMMQIIEVWKEC